MVTMKKFMRVIAVVLFGALGTSCSTSYDSYGNRRQSIDPAGAAIGAVALGAIAYSVGRSSGKKSEHRRHTSGHHNYGYGNHGYGGNSYGRGSYGGRFCR